LLTFWRRSGARSIAVICLTLIGVIMISFFVRHLLALMEFGLSLDLALQAESTWSIEGPFLVYAAVYGLLAVGIALRWRIAHVLAVVATSWLVVGAIAGLAGGYELPVELVAATALSAIAFVALLGSWRDFWKRRGDVSCPS